MIMGTRPGGRPGGGPGGGTGAGTGGMMKGWAFGLREPNKGVVLWNRCFNTSDRAFQPFW